ncbi:hypothetical protein CLCR_06459 [Cladophialophora carrionii]|uniref:Uncharacterized protein n=1 Tax=Cladophialophora carrionii TaxID=86049 RepID=A0A1C1C790_9EURO|nr:hypothetical protein CLCR_06459 [Cladophialophora carrionii]
MTPIPIPILIPIPIWIQFIWIQFIWIQFIWIQFIWTQYTLRLPRSFDPMNPFDEQTNTRTTETTEQGDKRTIKPSRYVKGETIRISLAIANFSISGT